LQVGTPAAVYREGHDNDRRGEKQIATGDDSGHYGQSFYRMRVEARKKFFDKDTEPSKTDKSFLKIRRPHNLTNQYIQK
jgi:hypothetical protein